mgnify:FL=1
MGCLVHVHADVVELGLEHLRIARQRHRNVHQRAMHEGLAGEITPPPVYRDVPRPTLVDSPSLLPFLRCEHDFLAYAAPAVVTPAHKETPPRGSWNGSFHKPRQRSGGLADHGDRVSRQAVPHLWSEHVWPHIRRLLTPYSYQWIGNSPRPKYSVVRGMNISACRLPSNGISRGQKDRPHFNRGAESAKLVWTMSVRRKRIIAMEQFHGDSCIPTNESMKILFAVLNPSSMHSGDNP